MLKNPIGNLPFSDFLNSPYNTGSTFPQPTPSPSPSTFTYYNFFNRGNAMNATGFVYDEFGAPIENAVIFIDVPENVPNNGSPQSQYLTFSKPDGSFDLKTHWTNVFNSDHGLKLNITAMKCQTKIIDLGSLGGTSVGNISLNYHVTNEGSIVESGVKNYTDLAAMELDDVTLNSGSKTNFIAEKKIHMKAGFKAYLGATSHLYLDNLHCPTNTNSDYDGVIPLQRTSIGKGTLVNELILEDNVTIYPNPSNTGQFNIEIKTESENTRIEVYDLIGRQVLSLDGSIGKQIISLAEQSKGIYLSLIHI